MSRSNNNISNDEISEKLRSIITQFAKIEECLKEDREKEAKNKVQRLVADLRQEQNKMLTSWAEKRSRTDEMFKQYSDFLRSIGFESGRVTHQNYITDFQAIKAAARESGNMIHKLFYK